MSNRTLPIFPIIGAIYKNKGANTLYRTLFQLHISLIRFIIF